MIFKEMTKYHWNVGNLTGKHYIFRGRSEKRKERKSESGDQGMLSKWKERGYKPQTQRDNGHDSDKYPLISNLSGHFSDHKCIFQ